MGAFSKDLRDRILQALEEDSSSLRVADRFGVSASFVRKLRIQMRTKGHSDPQYHGGRKRIMKPQHESEVKAILDVTPSATLSELRRELKKRTKLAVSESTMSRTLRRLGFTKKRKTIEATERQNPDVKAKRAAFLIKRTAWSASRLIFIDETGITLTMTSREAWAPAGQRAIGSAPFRRGENATLVAALTTNGIQAPFLFRGAMDGLALRAYVGDVLIPELQSGDIIVWDNLAVHEDTVVRDLLSAHGILLEFLPPYSPDLNPIELAWASMKRVLRRLATREWSKLIQAVRQSLSSISADTSLNWIRHCGYLCQ